MTLVSVATLNIRGAWGSTQRAIGRLLAECDPAVVCLQECWHGAAEAIREALGPSWSSTMGADDVTSNAILSRYPLSAVRTVDLDVAGPHESRSAVLATLELPQSGAWDVCCTHLEHADEPTRLLQWAKLRAQVPGEVIVCGDLNALRRADYSIEAWQAITLVRASNSWEPPASELTGRLDAQGFRDAWGEVGRGAVEGTCRFGTRVDYILLSRGFPAAFAPGSYRRIPAIGPGLSDHDLIVVDLQGLGP